MSKALSLGTFTHLRNLVSLDSENKSRPGDKLVDPNKGKGKELRYSMVTDGWLKDAAGAVKAELVTDKMRPGFMGHTELMKKWHAQIEEKKSLLEEKYNSAKGLEKEHLEKVLKVFDEIYYPKGKIYTPKVGEYFYLTAGHQRSHVCLYACADRIIGGKFDDVEIKPNSSYEDIIGEIPVIVATYRNEEHRLDEQLKENIIPKVGRSDLSYRDHIGVAERLIKEGKNQNAVRKALGGSSNPNPGIRAHAVIMLNAAFPTVRFKERLLMEKGTSENPNPDYIPYSKIGDSRDMPTLLKRSDKDLLEEENGKRAERRNAGEDIENLRPLTAKEFEENVIQWSWLKNPKFKPEGVKDTTPTSKSMAMTKLKEITAATESTLLTSVKDAINDNDVNALKPIQDMVRLTNALHSCYTSWKFKVDSEKNILGPMGQLCDLLEYLATLDAESASELLETLNSSVE